MLDVSVPMKRCGKCGEEKPATPEYFYRNRTQALGLANRCKACQSVASRTYRLSNPEKTKQSAHNWYERNKAQKNVKRDQYRKNNSKLINARQRRWRQKNLHKARRWCQEYRLRNLECLRRSQREYQAKHRVAKKAEKLHKKLIRTGIMTPASEYFHGYCAVCTVELSKDAKSVIWTQSKPDMLVPLCNQCVADKGNNEPKEWLTRRYNAQRVAEILRIMKDYSIWLEEVVNHAN